MADKYRAAGLDLVAIGSEAAEAPSASAPAGAKKLGPDFPFPLLADPSHATFRAFGSYDDFEKQPLHGTFLIDAAGRVRWLDVGPDPFTDAAFLLGEAKRLLGVSGGPTTTTALRPAAPTGDARP
jgi:alkyl hydroperoxide reductase subunit AhpC